MIHISNKTNLIFAGHLICRLQLKRGLFWYRHYPKLHQMVKYGSSRALIQSFVAKLRCASFSIRKNEEKWLDGPKKHTNVDVRETKSLRSYMPHTKVGKNKSLNIIHSKLINLIIYNHIWSKSISNHMKPARGPQTMFVCQWLLWNYCRASYGKPSEVC